MRYSLTRCLLVLSLCLILVSGTFAVASAAPSQAGVCKCQKGGQYSWTVDWNGLHHYIQFNVGNYATKNGSAWSLQPSSVTAKVKIGNTTVTKVFGTSLWPVERDKSYVRFGINGNGIVSLLTNASTFTVCWDQK